MQARKLILILVVGALAGSAFYIARNLRSGSQRGQTVWAFLTNPASQPGLTIQAGTRCGAAPFSFPTDGLVGYIWDDSFRPGHRHAGIDIFSGSGVGVTPIYAAYPGYLTRQPDWKSSLIVRIPSDPLNPGQQIWTYYTHMADSNGSSTIAPAFPPGTSEVYVEAGTLLGYQGNYSGTPGSPVGVHLHFSVVKDDGLGRYLNELEIENTLDPSPYLGLALNARQNPDAIPACGEP
ncbi:MAG: M23 family metallopeptidase [Anaerolineales bacterium]|jgi:murein DD-endopeptidase MepM/ murein hydrolase activator NlpD|nr:M23 family metallopeptidase [Anaerolineales bacterium]